MFSSFISLCTTCEGRREKSNIDRFNKRRERFYWSASLNDAAGSREGVGRGQHAARGDIEADLDAVAELEAVDDLLEEPAGLLLAEALLPANVVQEAATRRVLHDDVDVGGRIDHLKQLDHVLISHALQDLDLPRDAPPVVAIGELTLLDHLDRYFPVAQVVDSEADLESHGGDNT